MPFVSQAQRAFAYATKAPWAAEFEAATPKGAKLPEHVRVQAHARSTAKRRIVASHSRAKPAKKEHPMANPNAPLPPGTPAVRRTFGRESLPFTRGGLQALVARNKDRRGEPRRHTEDEAIDPATGKPAWKGEVRKRAFAQIRQHLGGSY